MKGVLKQFCLHFVKIVLDWMYGTQGSGDITARYWPGGMLFTATSSGDLLSSAVDSGDVRKQSTPKITVVCLFG